MGTTVSVPCVIADDANAGDDSRTPGEGSGSAGDAVDAGAVGDGVGPRLGPRAVLAAVRCCCLC